MEKIIEKVLDTLKHQGARIVNTTESGMQSNILLLPSGLNAHSLEGLQTAPNRIAGAVDLHRYDDFVQYVNDFKGKGARIFVTPDVAFSKGGVLAVAYLDYPEPGKPAWSAHTARLIVSPSLEYQLLTSLVAQGLHDQPKFAQALRDVSRFCTTLPSAQLLEIVQTLTLQSKGDFASVEDNFSGSVRFGYDVQVSASSEATKRMNIEVPQQIGFNLPVLHGGDAVDIVADLLYRVPSSKDQKVQMGIALPDRKFVERAVLEQTADKIGAATNLTVALGSSSVPTEQDSSV